jgi:hypothetical protein
MSDDMVGRVKKECTQYIHSCLLSLRFRFGSNQWTTWQLFHECFKVVRTFSLFDASIRKHTFSEDSSHLESWIDHRGKKSHAQAS